MSLGQHATAFSFLKDILEDEYLSIARCGIGEPCRIEFYEADGSSRHSGASGEPIQTVRVPTGISSLVHDSSIGASPLTGGNFAVSFTGMTPANIEATESTGGDPEVSGSALAANLCATRSCDWPPLT